MCFSVILSGLLVYLSQPRKTADVYVAMSQSKLNLKASSCYGVGVFCFLFFLFGLTSEDWLSQAQLWAEMLPVGKLFMVRMAAKNLDHVPVNQVALRQAAKPFANYMQGKAETSPSFRTACISLARFYHRMEFRLVQSFYERQATPTPRLNEERAVKLGTTLIGEFVVFAVAAGGLAAEYSRSSIKEATRERSLYEQLNSLEAKVDQLTAQLKSSQDGAVEVT